MREKRSTNFHYVGGGRHHSSRVEKILKGVTRNLILPGREGRQGPFCQTFLFVLGNGIERAKGKVESAGIGCVSRVWRGTKSLRIIIVREKFKDVFICRELQTSKREGRPGGAKVTVGGGGGANRKNKEDA